MSNATVLLLKLNLSVAVLTLSDSVIIYICPSNIQITTVIFFCAFDKMLWSFLINVNQYSASEDVSRRLISALRR